MTQFIQLETAILKNKDLNSDEKIALALIIDRMKSSVKRKNQFYDKNYSDYYVIYTISEMMEDLGISKGTTVKIFKKLERLGFIIKRKFFNKATRLFLPKFKENYQDNSQSLKFEPSKVQILDSNQTDLNHIKTNDTSDTHRTKNNILNQNKVIAKDELEVLGQSLVKNAGIPESIVKILQLYSFGDVEKLYNYAGIIFKAKNFAKRQAEKSLGSTYSAFRFESNQLINTTLGTQLKSIIMNANKKAHNVQGYIMRSLINLFEEQANKYLMLT